VITNSASVAVFSINATTTIAGAFLSSDNTKSGTTGVLFSVANFASPGDRAVVSGDTLNVTYTFSLDAA
jgi:mevalonate kinase